MPNQPLKTATRFSVDTQFHIRRPDTDPKVVDNDVTYTPETWPEAVEELGKEVQRRFHESHCLLADKRIPESRRSRKEHVIPEASGIKWIKVPPGFVDDDINNRLSYSEKELFQKGDMGTLRPYYLRK